MRLLSLQTLRGSARCWADRAAAGMVAVYVLVGAGAAWLLPADPLEQHGAARLLPPGSPGHLLGTDLLGRDVLAGLIAGAQTSLFTVLAVSSAAILSGLLIGFGSGMVGGRVDAAIGCVTATWAAVPLLLLALAVLTALGPGIWPVILALAFSQWVLYARLARDLTGRLRGRGFVLAAGLLGVGPLTILRTHMLPHAAGPVLVIALREAGVIIVTSAALTFLGFGAGAEVPAWGAQIAEASTQLAAAWWTAALPALIITTVVAALNRLSDSLGTALQEAAGAPLSPAGAGRCAAQG